MVWLFRRDGSIAQASVANVGLETDFYGEGDLEDDLAARETGFANFVASCVTALQVTAVDAELAAELCYVQSVRTRYMRLLMQRLGHWTTNELQERFANNDLIATGIREHLRDNEAPFKDKLRADFAGAVPPPWLNPIVEAIYGLMAKISGEQLATLPSQIGEQLATFLGSLNLNMEKFIAGAQIKALGRVLNEPGDRLSSLKRMEWQTQPYPTGPLVLGDVGPLAASELSEDLRPLGVVPEPTIVLLPLSPKTLLVGRDPPTQGYEAAELRADDVCTALARNSAEFIVSSQHTSRESALAQIIGTNNESTIRHVTSR